MDTAIEQAIALFQENPIYWAGIILWLLGFVAYVPTACGKGRLILGKTGTLLCWLGFGLTLIAFVAHDGHRAPPFERPTFNAAYWLSSHTQIWLLWIAGSALIVASWVGWLTHLAGWLGITTTMIGVLASWPTDEPVRRVVIVAGVAIVIMVLIATALRGELRPRRIDPGDYEAELIELCEGSRREADRLIREEMQRRPELSRVGAALAVVTRLRHGRDPYPPPL